MCIWIVNPFLSKIIGILPYGLGKVILIIAYVVIVIDFIGTISGILSVHIRLARLGKLVLVEEVADNLQKAADYMGNGLTGWVLKHLEKSHEGLEIKEIIRSKLQRREKAQEMTGVFAAGCGFYKLFWLFFLGSFLGDITETIFCWWKKMCIRDRSGSAIMEEYTQRLTESSWDNKEWICSICGRQNKEEFKYCPECGEKKPDHEETQTEITIKKLKRKGFENCEQLFRLLIHVEDEEGNLLGSYNMTLHGYATKPVSYTHLIRFPYRKCRERKLM